MSLATAPSISARIGLQPNPIASLLLIAILILRHSERRINGKDIAIDVVAVSVGSTLSYSPTLSSAIGEDIKTLLLTFAITTIYAAWAVLLVFLGSKAGPLFDNGSGWAFYHFSLIWASGWYFLGAISPLGRQGDWTIYEPFFLDQFGWIVPIFGEVGVDFISASMAYLVFELFHARRHSIGEDRQRKVAALIDVREEELDDIELVQEPSGGSRGLLPLFLFLLAVVLPSQLSSSPTPPAPNSPFVSMTCVLPRQHSSSRSSPTFKEYLRETELLSSNSKLLLWPEAAVHFDKDNLYEGLAAIGHLSSQGRTFVGVGYTAPYNLLNLSNPDDTFTSKSANAFTLFDPEGRQLFTYLKQQLVPMAESFAFRSGSGPIPSAKIAIPIPPSRSANPKRPNSVDLTVSPAICHDTSFPSLLTSQASKSDLILSPSSIWSTPLAWSRIHHLSLRSKTNGFSVFTCDGGEGGISSFVDAEGRVRAWQAGNGQSFTVEVQTNPTVGKSTFFAQLGWSGILGLVWGVGAIGWGTRIAASKENIRLIDRLTHRDGRLGTTEVAGSCWNWNYPISPLTWLRRATSGRDRGSGDENQEAPRNLIDVDEDTV
ncbi:hypothetical protein BT69DRAFT_1347165 [Atractiella rhizophila]|nr:hypothetical protein BT69DRAFT_1347165 [Atractiella rhizophila]